HNDHIRGNQVFSQAVIIATPEIKKLIEMTEPEEIEDENTNAPSRMKYYDSLGSSKNKWQASEDSIWRGYYEGIVKSHPVLKTVLPSLLFPDSITISGTNTIIKLISYGGGHTSSDLFLFLPNEKIAF